MRSINVIERQFALCESCFWCATIFHKVIKEREYNADDNYQICPMCKDKSVSFMQLAKDERYNIAFGDKSGLEMKFSKL